MFDYIVKYASGGSLIDTSLMKSDLKSDSQFFKDGDYTNKGRKRLAAIQQIEDNQKSGLSYKINDKTQTFTIVDKYGKNLVDSEGRGMATFEGGPLYGVLNRKKSARKEISQAIATASKLKPKEVITNTIVDNTKVEKLTKEKEELKSKIKDLISTTSSNVDIALDSKNKEENSNTEAQIKSVTDLNNKKSITDPVNTTVSGSILNKDLSEAEVLKNKSDWYKLEKDLLRNKKLVSKPTIESEKKTVIDFDKIEDAKKVLRNRLVETEDKIREHLKQNKMSLKGDIKASPAYKVIEDQLKLLESASEDPKHKKVREYLQNQKSTILSKDVVNHIDATKLKKIDSNIEYLDNLRNKKFNEGAESTKSEKSLINRYIKGGQLIPKMQNGSLLSDPSILDELRKKNPKYIKEQLKLNFSDPRFGRTANYSDLNSITLQEKSDRDKINNGTYDTRVMDSDLPIGNDPMILKDDKKGFLKKLFPDKFKQDIEREDKAPLLSRTGINTPVGDIQYNDIAQFLLARRAYKRKIADVAVPQEEYSFRGSRNVLAARDLDAATINAAENSIASIDSGYSGSDPVMNMIANKMTSGQKEGLRRDVIMKRGEYRRGEEDRVATEMENKRMQQADDMTGFTAVKNKNKLMEYQGALEKARSETEKESQWTSNLSSLFTNIQSRWNKNQDIRLNMKSALDAEQRSKAYSTAANKYQTLSSRIQDLKYYKNKDLQNIKETDPEKIKLAQKIIEDRYKPDLESYTKEFESAILDLNNLSGNNTKSIMKEADKIAKGEKLLRKR